MAMGIVVILVGIVVVAAVVIGVAMLVMIVINGSAKAMPDQPDTQHPVDRKEILEKLERKEITAEEAERALNPTLTDESKPPTASSRASIGCVLGVMAAVVIGTLLILGIVMTLFFARTRKAEEIHLMRQNAQQEQMLREIKQSELVESDTVESGQPEKQDAATLEAEPETTDKNVKDDTP